MLELKKAVVLQKHLYGAVFDFDVSGSHELMVGL
jgi:hypothetical protein